MKLNWKHATAALVIGYVGYKIYKKEPIFGKKQVPAVEAAATTRPMEVVEETKK